MEVVRSALANVEGVSNLKIPGSKARNPSVTIKGQLIQYTGLAKAADVITILHQKTALKVREGSPPSR